VRRSLTWLAGAVGLAALLRHLSRRRAPVAAPSAPAPPPVAPVEEDPADELRRRLADRQGGDPGDANGDTVPEPEDLEQRRARVHAKAQEAIDSMRDTGTDAEDDAPNGDAVA